MRFNNNLLVILNPSKDEQVALDKAIRLADRWTANITALLGSKHASPEILAKLDEKLKAATDKGIKVTVKVSDERTWFRALMRTVHERDFGLIIKEPHNPKLTDHVFLPDDWKLLRSTRHPVLLVHSYNKWSDSPLMLCVDGSPQDQEHKELNEMIIRGGRLVSSVTKSPIHLFSAYPSVMQDASGSQPSESTVAKQFLATCQSLIPEKLAGSVEVHVEAGPPELLIPEHAQKLKANLVIMGTIARSGLKGVLLGNTAEQVASRLKTDLIVLPPAS